MCRGSYHQGGPPSTHVQKDVSSTKRNTETQSADTPRPKKPHLLPRRAETETGSVISQNSTKTRWSRMHPKPCRKKWQPKLLSMSAELTHQTAAMILICIPIFRAERLRLKVWHERSECQYLPGACWRGGRRLTRGDAPGDPNPSAFAPLPSPLARPRSPEATPYVSLT